MVFVSNGVCVGSDRTVFPFYRVHGEKKTARKLKGETSTRGHSMKGPNEVGGEGGGPLKRETENIP